jgi:hypothetical protein
MPQLIKATEGNRTEILLVAYPDSPRYEVRVYVADAPQDHRTLIATDNITEAEAIYRRRVARL